MVDWRVYLPQCSFFVTVLSAVDYRGCPSHYELILPSSLRCMQIAIKHRMVIVGMDTQRVCVENLHRGMLTSASCLAFSSRKMDW